MGSIINASNLSTRLSLLRRLKDSPDDQVAWAEFVAQYQPAIERWCRGYGLQHADAKDVTQTVLLKIAQHMRRFEYRKGGRFRSWLKTVVQNAWRDFAKSRQINGSGDEAIERLLNSVEANDELMERIEREYDHQVLSEAMGIIRQRVKPHIWEAFSLMALSGAPVESVSKQLDISVGNAYVCKNRVQKMLTEEVSRLDKD
ncbi:MAG: sigma-70 family RNA polymerase sigma factor [Planctomycetota bacterium]